MEKELFKELISSILEVKTLFPKEDSSCLASGSLPTPLEPDLKLQELGLSIENMDSLDRYIYILMKLHPNSGIKHEDLKLDKNAKTELAKSVMKKLGIEELDGSKPL